jgi:alanyl-tRNA synthetase
MTIKAYLRDPALAGAVTISAVIPGEQPVVRLDETWFHPQGGGQKADRGAIGPAQVVGVRHAEAGEVDHVVSSLDGLAVGGTYLFAIDPDWRLANARLHSAGHLLAAVAEAMFDGVVAVNGHHWPGEARVEFKGAGLAEAAAAMAALEAGVNRAIADGLPIVLEGDPFASRRIQVGAYAPVPCGGTHVASTADLGQVRLRSARIKGDILRIGYDVA